MKLTNEGLKDIKAWEDKGYVLPKFDREKITAGEACAEVKLEDNAQADIKVGK